MATIELVDIRKTYPGGAQVVHGINLSIGDGELVVLVGPSGCGKSTLLRMIAGLETVTGGTISIGGKNVNAVEPADRDIAMVFQNYALYPHMTVRGNLEYGLKNRNTPREQIDQRVAEAAKMLEITPFLDRKPRQLSGGQRQRVAMGRALVRQPKAFLFDEPLSNLDAKLRGQMRIEIKRLQRTMQTTSVYVTHDQLEAMTLADRLVVMNAGRIEQVGTPIELYEKPASVFVAGFIGSPPMNFIDMASFDAPAREQVAGLANGADLVGIRPDAVSFTAPASRSLALNGAIELIEPIGAECHIHLRWNDQLLVAEYRGVPPFTEGSQQPFFLDRSAMHFFDKATGARR